MATIRCPLNEAAHISMNESAIVSSDGALLFTETEQCVGDGGAAHEKGGARR
jgi:hypothetical protein